MTRKKEGANFTIVFYSRRLRIRIRAKRGQRAQSKWGVWKNRTINLFPVKHQMRRSLRTEVEALEEGIKRNHGRWSNR